MPPPSPHTYTTCLSPELFCAYVHHLVSNKQEEAIERHLRRCEACLLELHEAVRIVVRLWPPRK